ncbi:MAG TPA: hypothetical protein VLC98_07215 [Phnomibacter sp.]|nr:hypothetical protein [Phnomibacter sp.]
MKQSLYISLTLHAVLLLFANRSISQTTQVKEMRYEDITLFAWNEDTSNSVQFALTKDKQFYYTIIKKDSVHAKKEYYHGKFKHSSDTLFLDYNANSFPIGFQNFLIVEASGSYLIQPIEDGKRLFLRLQRLGHRTYGNIPQ